MHLIFKSPHIHTKGNFHEINYVDCTWSWESVREFALQVKFLQFESMNAKEKNCNIEAFQKIFQVIIQMHYYIANTVIFVILSIIIIIKETERMLQAHQKLMPYGATLVKKGKTLKLQCCYENVGLFIGYVSCYTVIPIMYNLLFNNYCTVG